MKAPDPIRIIIAGGRDFADTFQLLQEMETLTHRWSQVTLDRIEVVCGMARGADLLGKDWAAHKGYAWKEFPAEWDKYGKKAGPLRNNEMAAYAGEYAYGVLVAFWDGKSTGTRDMILTALTAGLEVHVYRYESEDQA